MKIYLTAYLLRSANSLDIFDIQIYVCSVGLSDEKFPKLVA